MNHIFFISFGTRYSVISEGNNKEGNTDLYYTCLAAGFETLAGSIDQREGYNSKTNHP